MLALCFCGNSCIPESYYCSPQCAREDAFNSLTLRKPHESESRLPPLPTLPTGFFDNLPPRRLHTHSSSLDIDDICPEDLIFAVDHGPFQHFQHSQRSQAFGGHPTTRSKSAPGRKRKTSQNSRKERKDRKDNRQKRNQQKEPERITSVPRSITPSVSSIAPPTRPSDWKSHYQRAQERASLEDTLDVPFFLDVLDTDQAKAQTQAKTRAQAQVPIHPNHDNDTDEFDNDNEKTDAQVTRPFPIPTHTRPHSPQISGSGDKNGGVSDESCQLPNARVEPPTLSSTRTGSLGPVTTSLPSIACLEEAAGENITGVNGNFPTLPAPINGPSCPSLPSLSNRHSHENEANLETKQVHHLSSSSYTTNFTSASATSTSGPSTSGTDTTRSSCTSSMGSSLDPSPTKPEFSKRKSKVKYGSAFGSPAIVDQKHPTTASTSTPIPTLNPSSTSNANASTSSSSILSPVIHLSIHFKEGLRLTRLQGHQRRPSSDRTPRVDKTPGFEIVYPPPSIQSPPASEPIKTHKSERSISKVSKLSFSSSRTKAAKDQREQKEERDREGRVSIDSTAARPRVSLDKAPGPTPILKRTWNPLKLSGSNTATMSNASNGSKASIPSKPSTSISTGTNASGSGSAPESLSSQPQSKLKANANEPTPSDSRRTPQTQSLAQSQTLTPTPAAAPIPVSVSSPSPVPVPVSAPAVPPASAPPPSTPATAPPSIPALPVASPVSTLPATSNASTFPPVPAIPSTLSRPGVIVKKTSLLPKGRLPIGSSITRSPQLQPTTPKQGQGQGQGQEIGSGIGGIGLSNRLPKSLPESKVKPSLQPPSYRAPAFAMSAPKIPVSTMSLRTSPSKKSLRGNGTDGHVKIPDVNDDPGLSLDKDREEDFGTVIQPKDNVSDVPQVPPVPGPAAQESEHEPVVSHMTGSYFKLYSAPKSRKASRAVRVEASDSTSEVNAIVEVKQDQPVDVTDTTDSETGDAVDTTSSGVSIVDMEDIANMTGVSISIARDSPIEFPFYVQEDLVKEKVVATTKQSRNRGQSPKDRERLTPKSSGLKINLISPESELRDLDPLELTPRGSPATSATSVQSGRSANSANSENLEEHDNERSPSTAGAPPTPRAQAEYQSFWFSSPDIAYQTLPPLPSLPPNYPLPAIPTQSTMPPLSALPTVSQFPPRPSTAEGLSPAVSPRKWGSDAGMAGHSTNLGIGRAGTGYFAYTGRDRGNSFDMPSSLSHQRRQQQQGQRHT